MRGDRPAVGRALDQVGRLMLPVALGAIAGFWAADQGVPLLPHTMTAALAWGLVAIGLMLGGRAIGGTMYSGPEQRVRRRVIGLWGLGLVAVLLSLGVWWSERDSALTRLSPEAFERSFSLDSALYVDHDREMDRLLDRIESAGIPGDDPTRVLTAEEEALVVETWGALLDHTVALDEIRRFWEDWYRWDPSRVERTYHLRSFLLTLAAEVCLVEKGARFSALVGGHANTVRFLDAAHPEHGIPADTLANFRRELLGTRDQARVVAGEQYLTALAIGTRGRTEARALGVDGLWTAAESHLATLRRLGFLERAAHTLVADTTLLREGVRRAWFPLQKGVAETMGDTRVRRAGWYLIDRTVTDPLDPELVPGDVLVSRKNWYLSNVGLPGFWPHAMLYVGDLAKLDAWAAADPEVADWIAAQAPPEGAPATFSALLQRRYPAAWRDWVAGNGDEPDRVIEAVSEGVIFNTLSHVGGDYFGALRPRVSALAKAQAIDAAFRHHGRPYDFDFDFATEDKVVCTELVWRAYRSVPDGLDLQTVRFAGRSTLPANDLLRNWRDAAPDASTFDFVLFIDAVEKEARVFRSNEEAFRRSVDRPKWDTAQR